MNLTKLRELQEQASPGPWKTVRNNHVELEVARMATCSARVVWSEAASMDVGYFIPVSDDDNGNANAKLAALAHHLLPLAEALEAWNHVMYECEAETCSCESRVHLRTMSKEMFEDTTKALTALQEALDE